MSDSCPRCQGFVILDLYRDPCYGIIPQWKCVNCGARVDADILANRAARETGKEVLA